MGDELMGSKVKSNNPNNSCPTSCQKTNRDETRIQKENSGKQTQTSRELFRLHARVCLKSQSLLIGSVNSIVIIGKILVNTGKFLHVNRKSNFLKSIWEFIDKWRTFWDKLDILNSEHSTAKLGIRFQKWEHCQGKSRNSKSHSNEVHWKFLHLFPKYEEILGSA